MYAIFFQNIMNECYRTHLEDDPPIFGEFKIRLNSLLNEKAKNAQNRTADDLLACGCLPFSFNSVKPLFLLNFI